MTMTPEERRLRKNKQKRESNARKRLTETPEEKAARKKYNTDWHAAHPECHARYWANQKILHPEKYGPKTKAGKPKKPPPPYDPEKQRVYSKRYQDKLRQDPVAYELRKARDNERRTARRNANPEPSRKTARESYHRLKEADPASFAAKQKEWRDAYIARTDPAEIRLSYKEWCDANRPRVRECCRRSSNRRRAKLKNSNSPGVCHEEWRAIVDVFSGRCAYCNIAEATTCEHILAIDNGGLDSVDNVLPACERCNESKGHKLLKDWKTCKTAIARASRQSFLLSTMNSPPIDINAIQCEEYIRDWLQL